MSWQHDIDAKLPDNTSGEITPGKLREAFQIIIGDMGNIHTFVAGSDMATKLMELKTSLDKVLHSTSTTTALPAFAGTINVDGAAGGFVMADMDNLVANPAHPGQDIKDGTAHYVKFAQINNPITDTHWIWVTDGGKTDRLWTNDAKSTAVDGMSVNVYINKGALVKIIKIGEAWFVKDVIIPAVSQGVVKAILSDGSVPMATGYAPAKDQDVATKKFVTDNAGTAGTTTGGASVQFAGVAEIKAGTTTDKAISPAVAKTTLLRTQGVGQQIVHGAITFTAPLNFHGALTLGDGAQPVVVTCNGGTIKGITGNPLTLLGTIIDAAQNRIRIKQMSPGAARPKTELAHQDELYVNLDDRQLGIQDAKGAPVDLLAITTFSEKAVYVANKLVVREGKLYRSKKGVPPHAWTASEWEEVGAGGGTQAAPAGTKYVLDDGSVPVNGHFLVKGLTQETKLEVQTGTAKSASIAVVDDKSTPLIMLRGAGSSPSLVANNHLTLEVPTGKNFHVKIGASREGSLLFSSGYNRMDPGYVATKDDSIATLKTIRDFVQTVEHVLTDYTAPTAAECAEAFKKLTKPMWKNNTDFYITDATGDKLVLVHYRATATATEAAPGKFFFEALTLAA